MLERKLNLLELLSKKSHFLFGPRGTGKTSLIKAQLAEKVTLINLLSSDFFLRLSARPAELEQIIASGGKKIIVIDEIQKIPELLNEVHRLIEDQKLKFLLTGSSARSLRRGGVNLLGGRAWTANLCPLTAAEIPEFNLERFLQYGGLPSVYLSTDPAEELQAYVSSYLTEEVAAESVVRDIPKFSRFIQKAALTSGEILNFSEIASDLGGSPTTIREYYRILEDTLIGRFVEPLRKPKSRKEISTAKFYIFDTGVLNTLRLIRTLQEGTEYFGTLFEHFIGQEIFAALAYQRIHQPLKFWRTHTQHEVDFVLADMLAVEVKATVSSASRMAKGLRYLSEDFNIKHKCVVTRDQVPRLEDGVEFLPYQIFLEKLWAGVYFK